MARGVQAQRALEVQESRDRIEWRDKDLISNAMSALDMRY